MAKKSRLVGKTVGSYRILKLLGAGGMGEVFLAEHPVIRSRVAIKVLHARFLTDANVVKRFIDEARAVNTISHPGIVRIHDCRRLDEVGVYLVMEMLEGESLLDKLRREGRQTPRFTARLLQQVGSALVIAHKAGIVHRDLKPANIFLVPDEDLPGGVRAKVLDFGVAKLKHDPGMDDGSTVTGAVFGSPRYMSPEQCLDTKNVDARSDVYSLGAIAYEMLTERAPYEAETLGKLVLQHQATKAPQVARLNFKVPPQLAQLIMSAVECKPEDRLPDMRELRNRVATLRWVDDESLTDIPASEESQATWEFELRPEDFDDEGAPSLPPKRPKSALDKLKELAKKKDGPAPDKAELQAAPTEVPRKKPTAREEVIAAPDSVGQGPASSWDEPLPEPEQSFELADGPDTGDESDLKFPEKLPPMAGKDDLTMGLAKRSWPGKDAWARTLKRGQRPTLLILTAVAMIIGGGRLMGAALESPVTTHGESRKSPTLRGCMGVPPAKVLTPLNPLAPASAKGKGKRPSVGRATSVDAVEGCYLSSEMLFLGLARLLPGDLSAEKLALTRALLLLTVVCLLTLALARWSARAALANSLLFAALITDPASLLWLGSFHLEFGHLLFLYTFLVLAIIVSQYSDGLGWHILLGISLGMVGMIHTHHRFLPLLLGLLTFLVLAGTHRHKAGRALAIYMIVAFGVIAVQGNSLEVEGPAKQQARAGSTSVVLGAILSAFEDPADGTDRLGLSPNCTAHAGVDGHALDLKTHHPCPDVLHMRRGKIMGTLLSYPGVGWRVLERGLARARPWVSGKLNGTAHAGKEPRGFSALIEALPEAAFMVLMVLFFLGALAALGRVLLSVFMGADPMGGVGVALLLSAAAGMEVFIATLFTEGYVDLDRHTHIMATTLLVCCALGLVALVREVIHRIRGIEY